MNIWLWLILTFFIINTVGAIYTVFHENRDVAATWAWLLTLILLPGVGFIIYLFIGKKMASSHIYDLQTQKSLGMSQLAEVQKEMLEENEIGGAVADDEYTKNTAILFLESNESLLTRGNQVDIIASGEEKFERFIADIRSAQEHIHLMYYIFHSDDIGRKVAAALEERAAAGVEVLVIYDALGTRDNDRNFFKKLKSLGGKTQVFFGSHIPFVNLRMNYRNHRKILVVDGMVGYVGGFNIGDEYLGKGPLGPWRDTHLRIQGNAVLSLQSRFFMDWNAVVSEEDRKDYADTYFPIATKVGNTAMQIVSSGPDSDIQAIKWGFIKIISQARESIYIQTPYFIPDESVHEALKIAALSGVEVNIMIPCKPDHPFVYRATEFFAKDILQYGARVFIYQEGFLHSKVLIVDEEISSVGTANMDVRSFRLNFEINAFIYSNEIAGELIQHFRMDQEKSLEATEEYFESQSRWLKFKQYFSRLLSPIL